MLELLFSKPAEGDYRILCLGAHCDDIEIGCGGTILTLLDKDRSVTVFWVTFSSDARRAREAEQSAAAFLREARSKEIVIERFRDGFFPYSGGEIKEYFEQLKRRFTPDVIFTHYRDDRHQDHRLISELTWNTYRDHLILEYEIPKYDGDLGTPNVFVHLDAATSRRKAEYIVNAFPSQEDKSWFDRKAFLSILRLRGLESNAPCKYAEAFHCRKMVWAGLSETRAGGER